MSAAPSNLPPGEVSHSASAHGDAASRPAPGEATSGNAPPCGQVHEAEQKAPPQPQPLRGPIRWLLYALSVVFLGLAILGFFLPGLPTTVFVLASAWTAARSSPRLHAWLRQHPMFGSILRNWEDGGYVNRKTKIIASLTMLASVGIMLALRSPAWVTVSAALCMTCVAIWLWLRPEGP